MYKRQGYGDTGHNEKYGLIEDGRDDMEGSSSIGAWASDYGMNAWSVGIELVHRGGEGDYPEAQLEALDGLIAYIDSYYGFESEIIDHLSLIHISLHLGRLVLYSRFARYG